MQCDDYAAVGAADCSGPRVFNPEIVFPLSAIRAATRLTRRGDFAPRPQSEPVSVAAVCRNYTADGPFCREALMSSIPLNILAFS
jgi:hypothetical protein